MLDEHRAVRRASKKLLIKDSMVGESSTQPFHSESSPAKNRAPSLPRPLPAQLVQSTREGRCVALVGAGFSKPAGLRDYLEILRSAVSHDEARQVLASDAAAFNDRLEAPNLTQQELDPIQQDLSYALGKDMLLRMFSEMLCGKQLPEDGLMVRQLAEMRRIPFAAILTSNWDDLLERYVCNGASGKQPRNPQGCERILSAGYPAKEGDAPLLKVQGDPSDSESFVVSHADYAKLLSDEAYMDFWRRLLDSRTLLFIGASLSGSYMNDFLHEAWQARQQCSQETSHCRPLPLGYTVLNDVGPNEAASFLEELGLHVISYDSAATNWQGNLQFLESLSRAVLAE